MAINAFSDWQQRVARPFEHGGWGLNRTAAATEDGTQASILSTYRGPGRERVLDALERTGLVDPAHRAAVDDIRAAQAQEQAAVDTAADAADEADRTRRAFGVATGGGAAQVADAGALSIMVVPDGARDLSPNMLRIHAARGYLPMGQSAYDALVAATDVARKLR